MTHALLRLLVLGVACFAFAATGHATPPQGVAQLNSLLGRAEANLNLVDGSIGQRTSPPKGSAAKLARLRLDQALTDLQAAEKIATKLSGKGAGEAEAKKRYGTADALYQKLDGILTGKPAPAPKPAPQPGPTPTPAPAPKPAPGPTVKLGYPHADNLKNTLFTLRRVEGDVDGLMKIMAEVLPLEDKLAVNHRVTANAVANATEAKRQAGFVRDGLAKIPANGEGVAEAVQRLADADASLDSALEFFSPLDAQLAKLVDPAQYPELRADLDRIRELGRAYRDPALQFQQSPEAAAEAFAQKDAALAECERIRAAYARLIQQDTPEGKSVAGSTAQFVSTREAFIAAATEKAAALPAEIQAAIVEIDRIADDAVKAQKPLWFTGGIPQQMGFLRQKLALIAAFDPEAGAPLQREVDALEANLAKRAESLRELIIRQNDLPADSYGKDDRDALVALAIDAWGHQEKDFEVLAVRIPSETWTRETKWTYSNGTWYFVDVSSLQIRLIVADKTNPELCIDRPINMRKDHQAGDRVIGVPLRSIDETLQPGEYLLRSRVQ